MYGREWGSHSCPPMILPSSRGTAALTHNRRGSVRFAVNHSFASNKDVPDVSTYVSLPAAPTISSRASSLMVTSEWSEDTWSHPGLFLYTASPAVHGPFLPPLVYPICFSTRCSYLLVPNVNLNLLSYQDPVFLFVHFYPNRQTLSLRREKEISCRLKQQTNPGRVFFPSQRTINSYWVPRFSNTSSSYHT